MEGGVGEREGEGGWEGGRSSWSSPFVVIATIIVIGVIIIIALSSFFFRSHCSPSSLCGPCSPGSHSSPGTMRDPTPSLIVPCGPESLGCLWVSGLFRGFKEWQREHRIGLTINALRHGGSMVFLLSPRSPMGREHGSR